MTDGPQNTALPPLRAAAMQPGIKSVGNALQKRRQRELGESVGQRSRSDINPPGGTTPRTYSPVRQAPQTAVYGSGEEVLEDYYGGALGAPSRSHQGPEAIGGSITPLAQEELRIPDGTYTLAQLQKLIAKTGMPAQAITDESEQVDEGWNPADYVRKTGGQAKNSKTSLAAAALGRLKGLRRQ